MRKLHLVIVVAACLTFAQFSPNPKAQTAPSLIQRPDKIEIFGTIGVDLFQRSFEITANQNVTELSLSSSDLVEEAGPAIILSDSIEITPSTRASLLKSGTQKFIIIIKNAVRAAKYTGTITI